MKIEIITHYAEDDPAMQGESVTDLIVDGKVIYGEQDQYHDRISSKIEGFLDALKVIKCDFSLVKIEVADCSELNDY